LEEKADEFLEEINKIKEKKPSYLYSVGEREKYKLGDFVGFKFPEGLIDLRHIQFESDVTFREAHIKGDLNLSNCVFKGYLAFILAIIKGSIILEDAHILGDGINFNEVGVNDDISIKNTVINGRFQLANINAINTVDLSKSRTTGTIFIDTCKQIHILNMSKTQLEGVLDIANTRIMDNFILDKAAIKGDLIITNSRISKIHGIDFKCSGDMKFTNVDIGKDDLLVSSKLHNGIINRMLLNKTNFDNISLHNLIINEADFEDVTLLKPKIKSKWFLSSMICGRPLEALYDEWVARYQNKNPNKQSRLIKKTEEVYRKLRGSLEKRNNKQYSRKMRAGELEMKLKGSYSLFEKIIIFLYRLLNGYGLRWLRILIIWIISILSFAWLGYQGKTATYEQYNHSLKQYEVKVIDELELPYAIWHSLETSSILIRPRLRIDGKTEDMLEGIEKIISPFLFLLFIQAAKNTINDK